MYNFGQGYRVNCGNAVFPFQRLPAPIATYISLQYTNKKIPSKNLAISVLGVVNKIKRKMDVKTLLSAKHTYLAYFIF